MKLPGIKECEKNYNNLLRLWEKDSAFQLPSEKKLQEARELCKNIPLFHVSSNPGSLLNEGQITPFRQRENTENISMIGTLDKESDLDKYAYFTYGKPFRGPGPYGFTFCFSVNYILKRFTYPDVFFSWGDIVSFLKNDNVTATSINDSELNQYYKTILPLDWIVKLCSYFLSGFYPNCLFDGIINDWHKSKHSYNTPLVGPEIKCASPLPINDSSLIIADENYLKFLNEQGSLHNISMDKILLMPYEKMNQFSKDTLSIIMKSQL